MLVLALIVYHLSVEYAHLCVHSLGKVMSMIPGLGQMMGKGTEEASAGEGREMIARDGGGREK